MTQQPDCESFGFNVEWYDAQADLLREYHLTIMVPPKQGAPLEAAMYDPRSKRQFLKRSPVPGLRMEELHVGSTITLNARQLRIKSYSDEHTRLALQAARGVINALTDPGAFSRLGWIISCLEGAGLFLCRLYLVSENDAPVTALQVAGTNAEERWAKAMAQLPQDCMRVVSEDEAKPYFEDRQRFPTTAAFNNCTLGIVRPHAVKAGRVGAILTAATEAGFELSAAKMIHLKRAEANELFDVYKGVLPYFAEVVDCMSAAPCFAMELRKQSNCVEDFRELCGPLDVDMAKHLRPKSLRARFGTSNAENAIHATDLEGDAEAEVRYMFQILA